MAETSLGCIRLGHPKDVIGSFQCVVIWQEDEFQNH